MTDYIEINNRRVGSGHPVYIVAEMSGNHNHNFDQAVKIIEAAKEAGADAIKLQTYTPDTMTIDCSNDYFRINGNIWEGKTLYELYSEAHTPWDWHPKLKEIASDLELDLFSTPFDDTAVEFLEGINVPAFKIASFEIVDIPLLRRIALTGKPIIMSTGMATLAEIDEAVRTIQETGNNQIALLKCTSAYPAIPEEMNLCTIPHMSKAFDLPVGLSDHTLGIAVPVTAAILDVCIIEKHLTLSRAFPGPDSVFSLEPSEFKEMVEAVHSAGKALGAVHYGAGRREMKNRAFSRSLFVVKDMEVGDVFTNDKIRSIRPGYGLHTRYLNEIIGRKAGKDIKRGTPLNWEHVRH